MPQKYDDKLSPRASCVKSYKKIKSRRRNAERSEVKQVLKEGLGGMFDGLR